MMEERSSRAPHGSFDGEKFGSAIKSAVLSAEHLFRLYVMLRSIISASGVIFTAEMIERRILGRFADHATGLAMKKSGGSHER